MKKTLKRTLSLVLVVLTFAVAFLPVTSAFAAGTYGFNSSSLTKTNYYNDNDPINRVFYVKTGSSSASRTIRFNQWAGKLGYYTYTSKSMAVMQKYHIFVYNTDTHKGEGSYDWNWTESKTIKLAKKNTNYLIVVYPATLDTVLKKYFLLDGHWGLTFDYKESPYWTISTSASIRYSDSDSKKISRNLWY